MAKVFLKPIVALRIIPRDAPVSSSVRRHKTPSEPDQSYRVHSNGLQGVLSGRGRGPQRPFPHPPAVTHTSFRESSAQDMFLPVPFQGLIIRYQNPHVYCSGPRGMTETRKCLSHFLSAFPKSPWQRVFPDFRSSLLSTPGSFKRHNVSNQSDSASQPRNHMPPEFCVRPPGCPSLPSHGAPLPSRRQLLTVVCPSPASHVTISQIRSNSLSFFTRPTCCPWCSRHTQLPSLHCPKSQTSFHLSSSIEILTTAFLTKPN